MNKVIGVFLLLSLFAGTANGQEEFGPVNTGAANFLQIASDTRRAGMGGVGVALTGGADAVFYNGASVLAEAAERGGFTYTFAPYMRESGSAYSLNTLGGWYKIDRKSAILAGFRYYKYPKMGMIEEGQWLGKNVHPKELSAEVGYARELMKELALSATFRFVHSDMGKMGDARSATAVAFDIGAIYKRDMALLSGAYWTAGLQVSNLGTKLRYLKTKESLPAMAKLGGSVELPVEDHRLLLSADLGYRLAPSDVEAMNVSAGAEYCYADCFKLRGGYHYGDRKKGDVSYATTGAGIRYADVQLDFAWLFAKRDVPVRNSFWLSLGFSFR